MSEQEYSPSRFLAAQLPRIRARQELTAQQLADRIADMGGSLDRAAISKVELGKRGVSLDEAVLLAAALNVSLLHLVVPPDFGDDPGSSGRTVWLTPKAGCDGATARAWLRGHQPLLTQDERVFYGAVPDDEQAAVRLGVDVYRYERLLDAVRRHAARGDTAGVDRALKALEAAAGADREMLAELAPKVEEEA